MSYNKHVYIVCISTNPSLSALVVIMNYVFYAVHITLYYIAPVNSNNVYSINITSKINSGSLVSNYMI